MKKVLSKTLGGLTPAYYLRHLFFGAAISAFFIYMALQSDAMKYNELVIYTVNTLLYPYARFVYESIMDFILGNNVFISNAILFLGVKIMTMVLCWAAAILIAPVGLAYLYYYHSKNQ